MEEERIQKSIIKKYRRSLWTPFIKAIKKYELIKPGDRIAVALSGGKDSMVLAVLLKELKKNGIDNFELGYLSIDPGYDEINLLKLKENAGKLNIPVEIHNKKIFDVASKAEKKACYMCAKMRRGTLYSLARELGYNKIALGHHYDDVIETILMNVIVTGIYMTMMPKLKSTNYEGLEIIRPLYFVREDDIIKWKDYLELDFLDCACSIGRSEEDSVRHKIKDLIKKLKSEFPNVESSIFASSNNVHTKAVISEVINGEKISFLDEY